MDDSKIMDAARFSRISPIIEHAILSDGYYEGVFQYRVKSPLIPSSNRLRGGIAILKARTAKSPQFARTGIALHELSLGGKRKTTSHPALRHGADTSALLRYHDKICRSFDCLQTLPSSDVNAKHQLIVNRSKEFLGSKPIHVLEVGVYFILSRPCGPRGQELWLRAPIS